MSNDLDLDFCFRIFLEQRVNINNKMRRWTRKERDTCVQNRR